MTENFNEGQLQGTAQISFGSSGPAKAARKPPLSIEVPQWQEYGTFDIWEQRFDS